jgi:hypothetical protein
MSMGRLLLALLVLGAGLWLVQTQHLFSPAADPGAAAAPADRARAAARASAAQNAQTEAASRSLDGQTPAGAVTENMTPAQVRALLGPPDTVDSETADSGASRERWTYRIAGKTVIFENGIVVRIE